MDAIIITPEEVDAAYPELTISKIDLSLYGESVVKAVFPEAEDLDVTEDGILSDSDGGQLYIGEDIIDYRTPHYSRYVNRLLYAKINTNSQFYDMSSFTSSMGADLDFMSADNAVCAAKDFLTGIGISVCGDPEVYALEYTLLEAVENEYYENDYLIPEKGQAFPVRKERWEPSDSLYFMEFSIDAGLPVYRGSFGNPSIGNYVPDYGVSVSYSKSGFESLTIYNPYDSQAVEHSQSADILGADGILNSVYSHYSNVIVTSPVYLRRMELCYVPTTTGNYEKFKLIPAWVCTMEQVFEEDGGETHTVASTLFFNASTGRELI